METSPTMTPPRWSTTREVYERAIEANKELIGVMDADDLVGLSCRALVRTLERRIERGGA